MEQEEIKMAEENKNSFTDEENEENENIKDQNDGKDDPGKSR